MRLCRTRAEGAPERLEGQAIRQLAGEGVQGLTPRVAHRQPLREALAGQTTAAQEVQARSQASLRYTAAPRAGLVVPQLEPALWRAHLSVGRLAGHLAEGAIPARQQQGGRVHLQAMPVWLPEERQAARPAAMAQLGLDHPVSVVLLVLRAAQAAAAERRRAAMAATADWPAEAAEAAALGAAPAQRVATVE